jgi:hypothetical protein
MLTHMITLGNIQPTAKTIFSCTEASVDATQIFWHPDHASVGVGFFDIMGTTLTALDELSPASPRPVSPARKK